MYRRACAHSDETIAAHPGRSPPDPPMEATLHRILTHMIAETHRHAGRADIVRELIVGVVGQRQDSRNTAPFDPGHFERAEWPAKGRRAGRTPFGALIAG
ncbi:MULTISPECIES: mycothiol transferase [unclassified Streptomyces]|uniref:mycothiol transferase n=1 Tax=unclassified Streptomyces TaxID=2593676 RepID=UPI0040423EEC